MSFTVIKDSLLHNRPHYHEFHTGKISVVEVGWINKAEQLIEIFVSK